MSKNTPTAPPIMDDEDQKVTVASEPTMEITVNSHSEDCIVQKIAALIHLRLDNINRNYLSLKVVEMTWMLQNSKINHEKLNVYFKNFNKNDVQLLSIGSSIRRAIISHSKFDFNGNLKLVYNNFLHKIAVNNSLIKAINLCREKEYFVRRSFPHVVVFDYVIDHDTLMKLVFCYHIFATLNLDQNGFDEYFQIVELLYDRLFILQKLVLKDISNARAELLKLLKNSPENFLIGQSSQLYGNLTENHEQQINDFQSVYEKFFEGAKEALEKIYSVETKKSCANKCLHPIKTFPDNLKAALNMIATMDKNYIAKINFFEKVIMPQIDFYLICYPQLNCFGKVYNRIRNDGIFLMKFNYCLAKGDFLLLAELASGYGLNKNIYDEMIDKYGAEWLTPTPKVAVVEVLQEMKNIVSIVAQKDVKEENPDDIQVIQKHKICFQSFQRNDLMNVCKTCLHMMQNE